jgi:hypothetical protein
VALKHAFTCAAMKTNKYAVECDPPIGLGALGLVFVVSALPRVARLAGLLPWNPSVSADAGPIVFARWRLLPSILPSNSCFIAGKAGCGTEPRCPIKNCARDVRSGHERGVSEWRIDDDKDVKRRGKDTISMGKEHREREANGA